MDGSSGLGSGSECMQVSLLCPSLVPGFPSKIQVLRASGCLIKGASLNWVPSLELLSRVGVGGGGCRMCIDELGC